MGLGTYNVCVVSTYRMGGSQERVVKVAIHEVGHCLKLPNCSNTFCVMTAGDGTQKILTNLHDACVVIVKRIFHFCSTVKKVLKTFVIKNIYYLTNFNTYK